MPTTTTAPTATKTTASPATAKAAKPRKPLPAPNTDFYYLYETLPAEELAIVKRVRYLAQEDELQAKGPLLRPREVRLPD